MTPDDKSKPVVKPVMTPVMTQLFYMDEKEPSKVRRWFGSVGPRLYSAVATSREAEARRFAATDDLGKDLWSER
jgi:hypothetical protein